MKLDKSIGNTNKQKEQKEQIQLPFNRPQRGQMFIETQAQKEHATPQGLNILVAKIPL